MSEIRSSTGQERDAKGRFSPGTSGNRSGRPPGIKDKRVTTRDEWLAPLLPEAVEKLHDAVRAGEKWAIEMTIAFSPPRPKPVDIDELAAFEERLNLLEEAAEIP